LPFIQDNVVFYNEDQLRTELDFSATLDKNHWWSGEDGNRTIIWFYPHFRMLYFYLLHPNYDYYWFFDDDISFPNADYEEFLRAHYDIAADCVITYIFSKEKNIAGVHSMDENMVAYHSKEFNWLTHYPGPGDKQPESVETNLGSYFPIVRLSNQALETLWRKHKEGYYGYSEGYVPTTLHNENLSLYSIYDKESEILANPSLLVHHKNYHQMKWENL